MVTPAKILSLIATIVFIFFPLTESESTKGSEKINHLSIGIIYSKVSDVAGIAEETQNIINNLGIFKNNEFSVNIKHYTVVEDAFKDLDDGKEIQILLIDPKIETEEIEKKYRNIELKSKGELRYYLVITKKSSKIKTIEDLVHKKDRVVCKGTENDSGAFSNVFLAQLSKIKDRVNIPLDAVTALRKLKNKGLMEKDEFDALTELKSGRRRLRKNIDQAEQESVGSFLYQALSDDIIHAIIISGSNKKFLPLGGSIIKSSSGMIKICNFNYQIMGYDQKEYDILREINNYLNIITINKYREFKIDKKYFFRNLLTKDCDGYNCSAVERINRIKIYISNRNENYDSLFSNLQQKIEKEGNRLSALTEDYAHQTDAVRIFYFLKLLGNNNAQIKITNIQNNLIKMNLDYGRAATSIFSKVFHYATAFSRFAESADYSQKDFYTLLDFSTAFLNVNKNGLAKHVLSIIEKENFEPMLTNRYKKDYYKSVFYNNMGTVNLRMGEYGEARDYYNKALMLPYLAEHRREFVRQNLRFLETVQDKPNFTFKLEY